MTTEPPTPAPDLTGLTGEMLLAVLEESAQLKARGELRLTHRQFWSECRAELLLRLTRAAAPDAGRVTINREDLREAIEAVTNTATAIMNRWEGEPPPDATDRIDSLYALTLRLRAALAQAGTEGE